MPRESLRRSIELWMAAMAIALAVLVVGAAVAWRFVFDSAPIVWPSVPRLYGWEALRLWDWVNPVFGCAVAAMFVGAVVRLLTRWRRATSWIPAVLALLSCAGTALLYSPFLGAIVRGVSRLTREVEEPAFALRAFATTVLATLSLAAVLIVSVALPRTPLLVRQSARAVTAGTTTLLLPLLLLVVVLPVTNEWLPTEWDRRDLLVPFRFRPCRGAMLWEVHRSQYDGRVRTNLFGRVDDLWTRFADPRRNGAEVKAVSVRGEFVWGYFWLDTISEASRLWVRRDDPAVIDCDRRERRERVVPAHWHRLGLD